MDVPQFVYSLSYCRTSGLLPLVFLFLFPPALFEFSWDFLNKTWDVHIFLLQSSLSQAPVWFLLLDMCSLSCGSACLSIIWGDSGLSCDLSSLMDLRRIAAFKSIQLFSCCKSPYMLGWKTAVHIVHFNK